MSNFLGAPAARSACLLIPLLLLMGCGGKPPDPSEAIRARFNEFQLHLLHNEVDASLPFLQPEFAKKRGEPDCKRALASIAAAYKQAGIKDGDIRIDKLDVHPKSNSAMVHFSQKTGGKWNAAASEKWVEVSGQWYYLP